MKELFSVAGSDGREHEADGFFKVVQVEPKFAYYNVPTNVKVHFKSAINNLSSACKSSQFGFYMLEDFTYDENSSIIYKRLTVKNDDDDYGSEGCILLASVLKSRGSLQLRTESKLFLKFNKRIINTNTSFLFKPKSSFQPSITPSATIISGGTRVVISGENIDQSAGDLKMFVQCFEMDSGLYWENQETCEVASPTSVQCKQPKLLFSEKLMKNLRLKAEENISVPLNLTGRAQLTFTLMFENESHTLTAPSIYNDPIIDTFHPYVQTFDIEKDKRIFIKGKWAKVKWSAAHEVLITVGDGRCEDIKRESRFEISCCPSFAATPSLLHPAKPLLVKVEIGHATYQLGYLKYSSTKVIFNVIIITMVTILSLVVVTRGAGTLATLLPAPTSVVKNIYSHHYLVKI
ncbi:hypothetical protein HELRODRAFT_193628 [Helobdella robusta]|uniref:IPT/TIG domain-containing protein n=1 Tax=Helobdella robusta TaxID=6412 RepID=T1FV75_HELRO|nr:hypothetical protein HELRODRAFT_193628 [Helobdella robusta]ESN95079.1 hypothetical protein HELRODRAFT_193628 [Helobdella robusta]